MDQMDEDFARKWQPGVTPPDSLISTLVAEIDRLRQLVADRHDRNLNDSKTIKRLQAEIEELRAGVEECNERVR